LCAALLAASILPAQACDVARTPPTKPDLAAVKPPRSGVVGKIVWVQTHDKNWRGIVTVRVVESFGEKLLPFIQVADPECCLCGGTEHELNKEVVSIVGRGGDQLYQLDY